MKKFEAEYFLDFEVARAFVKPGKVTLNRPLIKILEDLGVPLSTFVELQNAAIQRTKNSFENIDELGNLLTSHNLGLSFHLKKLFDRFSVLLGMTAIDLLSESYRTLPSIFQTAVNHALRDLKYSSKIPVPGSFSFVGVADEFGYLKPDEIYACAYDPKTKETTYVEGPVCIYRSPTLHPGDVQIVTAIGKIPDHISTGLKKLQNVVVFSVHPGSVRSLPSCLSGGDLDGDEYCLLLNKDLFPRKRAPSSAYEPAEKTRTAFPCTIMDVADFVGNYILSDMVGLVATRHLILADMSPYGTCDPACIRLAALASHAVDFPKSGTPVKIFDMPKLPEDKRPDYLSPEVIGRGSTGNYYKSEKAIGVLYRSIGIFKKKQISVNSLTSNIRQLTFSDNAFHDPITVAILHLVEPYPFKFDTVLQPEESRYATAFVSRYIKEFVMIAKTNSMVRGKVLTEAEVLVCSILDPSRQPRKRKSLMNSMRLQTQDFFCRLRHEIESPDILRTIKNCWSIWILSRQAKAYGTESIGLISLNILLEFLERVI
jgi:RNA-dependent RNA polymerase